MQTRALVDAMTNMDMLRSSEIILHRLEVPVQRILLAAYNKVKDLANAINQQIVMEVKKIPIPVKCDPDKLRSALVNLLDNAISFTPEHGQIRVGAESQASAEVLSWVQEDGIGNHWGKLKKIFAEFYQIEPHTTRTYGGMAIGLSLAKGLVEAHGGKVWAGSPGLGRGATYKVLLPCLNTTGLQAMML